jgi:hypothetical protein
LRWVGGSVDRRVGESGVCGSGVRGRRWRSQPVRKRAFAAPPLVGPFHAPLYEKCSKSLIPKRRFGWISQSEKLWLVLRSWILGLWTSGFEDGYLKVRFSRMDIWKSGFPGWIPGARNWISGDGFLIVILFSLELMHSCCSRKVARLAHFARASTINP